MAGKLGKRPPREDRRTLRLSDYRVAAPKAPPRIWGFGSLFSDWGMLGNDQYGDCVFAGAGHETMLWDTVRKGPGVRITEANALADYGAVTGFDPRDPSSDQGTVVLDALKYRRKTGIVDAVGKRHKIAAYASLEAQDFEGMVAAAYEFGAVGIGFEFPDTAMEQFDDGDYWDVETGSSIEGGHYVPIVGSRNSAARVTCITWGRRQQMTKRFYEAFNDEAWVLLSEEMIRADGSGLHGYDWERFQADLAAL